MNKEVFQTLIEKGTKFYLYFYSPSCGGCKVMNPKINKSDLPIHKVVGPENQELLEALNVSVYPSIVEFENKSHKLYSGSIKIKELLNQ